MAVFDCGSFTRSLPPPFRKICSFVLGGNICRVFLSKVVTILKLNFHLSFWLRCRERQTTRILVLQPPPLFCQQSRSLYCEMVPPLFVLPLVWMGGKLILVWRRKWWVNEIVLLSEFPVFMQFSISLIFVIIMGVLEALHRTPFFCSGRMCFV